MLYPPDLGSEGHEVNRIDREGERTVAPVESDRFRILYHLVKGI